MSGKKATETDEFAHDFLFLRSADSQGKAHGGFQWPTVAGGVVFAPDWNPGPVCGGGLHGLAEGIGDWGLLKAPSDPLALWYVCGGLRSETVTVDESKVKVPRCRVLYVGSFAGAMDMISPRMTDEVMRMVDERRKATGCCGAASNSGHRGAASNSGDGGAASSVGKYGVALSCGIYSRGMVTKSNLLVLVERDHETGAILHHFAAMCGRNGVKPNVWYTLVDGKLTKVLS